MRQKYSTDDMLRITGAKRTVLIDLTRLHKDPSVRRDRPLLRPTWPGSRGRGKDFQNLYSQEELDLFTEYVVLRRALNNLISRMRAKVKEQTKGSPNEK